MIESSAGENEQEGMPLVQIAVPIYNEGENVKILYQTLQAAYPGFDRLSFVYDRDDETALPYLRDIAGRDPRVKAEKNGYSRGVLNALRWAFRQAAPGPLIVVMGDNSDKLSIIDEMVALWKDGATIVSPSRYMPGGKQHGGPPLKSFLSGTSGRAIKLFGFPTADPTNNFKLYDGEWIRSQSIESTGGFEVAIELCYKAYREGKAIVELPTEWFDRQLGKSNFKLWSWIPRYLYWWFKILCLLPTRYLRSKVV